MLADFRPFRPWRYDMQKVQAEAVLAPPYDVISEKQQDALYEKSPYNCIRLILNRILPSDTESDNRYTRARDFFNQWRKEGILTQEDKPCFYLYQQKFADLHDGSEQTRTAFLGALHIEAFENEVVIPHEKTLAKPKADRLALLEKTETNLSPIFGLFADRGGEVVGLIPELVKNKPLFSVVDGDGVTQSLWVIDHKEHLQKIQESLAAEKVYIADGHHRYTTALNYGLKKREAAGNPAGFLGSDFVYTALVSFQDAGLALMPTHRMLVDVKGFDGAALKEKLAAYFDIKATAPADLQLAIDAAPRQPSVFGFVLSETEGYLLTLRETAKAREAMLPGKPEVWYNLDVNVLAYLVFKSMLGLSETDWENHLNFSHSDKETLEFVKQKKVQAAFLLKAPRVEVLSEMGEVRELMPQKSTYFYPKLASGLLFYSHQGDQVVGPKLQ